MRLTLDTMTATTGWSVTSGTATLSVTDWSQFAVAYATSQLQMVATAGAVVSKTLATPLDITGYNTISVPLVASTSETVVTSADFRLKVRFYNDLVYEEFYVHVNQAFYPRVFAVTLDTITKIEFHFVTDLTLMLASISAYVDTMPYDAYTAIADLITETVATLPKFQIGTTTCSSGDQSITITGLKYADKHVLVEIGTEIHQIMSPVSKNMVTFGTFGDGKAMLGNHINAPVYLYVSPQIEPGEYDAFIPSLSISKGFGAETVEDEEPYSTITDSWNTEDDTVRVLVQGTCFRYNIVVQASARIAEIDEYLLKVMKKAFNKQTTVWINDRKHDLISKNIEWVEYGDATEILSKIQVECTIECAEELWQQETQVVDLTVTKSVTLMDR